MHFPKFPQNRDLGGISIFPWGQRLRYAFYQARLLMIAMLDFGAEHQEFLDGTVAFFRIVKPWF